MAGAIAVTETKFTNIEGGAVMMNSDNRIKQNVKDAVEQLGSKLDNQLAELRARHNAEVDALVSGIMNEFKEMITFNLILVGAVDTTTASAKPAPQASKYMIATAQPSLPKEKAATPEEEDPIVVDEGPQLDDSDVIVCSQVEEEDDDDSFVEQDGYPEYCEPRSRGRGGRRYKEDEEEEEEEEEEEDDSNNPDIDLEKTRAKDEANYAAKEDPNAHGHEGKKLIDFLKDIRKDYKKKRWVDMPVWGKEFEGYLQGIQNEKGGRNVHRTLDRIQLMFSNEGATYTGVKLQETRKCVCAFCGVRRTCSYLFTLQPNEVLVYDEELVKLYSGSCCYKIADPLITMFYYMFRYTKLDDNMEVYTNMKKSIDRLAVGYREKAQAVNRMVANKTGASIPAEIQRYGTVVPSSSSSPMSPVQTRSRGGRKRNRVDIEDDDDEEYKDIVEEEEGAVASSSSSSTTRRVSARLKKRTTILDLTGNSN